MVSEVPTSSSSQRSEKRPVSASEEDSDEEVVGPQPAPSKEPEEDAKPAKRRKVLEYEELYVENLPDAQFYETSYMHRDQIHFIVATKTNFVITASCDGHVKFWKKQEEGIEFVKHFRSHLGNIQDVAVNSSGTLFCTSSNDKSLKVFDVVNFDMINMMKLDYVPFCCEWIHCSGDAIPALALSEEGSNVIRIYDGQGSNEPLKVLENIHRCPVTLIKFNPTYETVISVDEKGMVEYWTGPKGEYGMPKNVSFDSKLDTDLFELVQGKTPFINLCFSPNGQFFAGLTSSRKVCIFKFLTGKLVKVIDESFTEIQKLQDEKQLLSTMEYGRRMAVERDLEKSGLLRLSTLIFDETSNFLIYPTIYGIKIVNIVTNRLVKTIGKPETLRFLSLALFQGKVKKFTAAPTAELEAADNPTLESSLPDPTLFCAAFKKNRFYLFTKRSADDPKNNDTDRDVFNEKPTKEEIIASTEATVGQKIFDTATIHTTKGDITIKLFGKECPKTAENFCVHSKNGYFNGHIFHRVIKGFMIQTGDPTGIGTGGESIWGGEFEDEFHPSLKHDRPYTVSMANAGANTNGSQFFITVIPTPWLDNKHTVFGRVTRGMEVVQNISMAKTHSKTDKPYDDICIINVTLR